MNTKRILYFRSSDWRQKKKSRKATRVPVLSFESVVLVLGGRWYLCCESFHHIFPLVTAPVPQADLPAFSSTSDFRREPPHSKLPGQLSLAEDKGRAACGRTAESSVRIDKRKVGSGLRRSQTGESIFF